MDVVPDTAISDVDGERNRIIVRGRDLADLAGKVSYEEMCHLVLGQETPNLAGGRLAGQLHLPPTGSMIGAIADSGLEGPALIAGAMAVAAARLSVPKSRADSSFGHAADFLRMATGSTDPARAKALEVYLVTMAENGLNTSTYAARIVASTGASDISCVVAALCALEGPLHGGAPGPVLDMLERIGSPDRAEAWVKARLASGGRIPGIGHRVFKGRDPRAGILERAAAALPDARRLETARAVERAVAAHGKPLFANVELFTAVLLDAVGLPRALFTPAFAVARVAGWCAHVAEQRANGKLIQPNARYVGPSPS
ncbi:MAG TPA: citrate/2-methylcitrate synthase [Planctomycetota bacterium]|nr:citrate/2-methylcitrate synthase [Planctomycetota bacterium]